MAGFLANYSGAVPEGDVAEREAAVLTLHIRVRRGVLKCLYMRVEKDLRSMNSQRGHAQNGLHSCRQVL